MVKKSIKYLLSLSVSFFIIAFLLPYGVKPVYGEGEYSSIAISAKYADAFFSPVIAMNDNDELSIEMQFVDFNYVGCLWMGFGVSYGYNNTNPFIHTLPDSTLIAYDFVKYMGDLGTAGSVVQYDNAIGFNVLLLADISIRAKFIYHGDNSEYSLSVKRPEDADFGEIQHATGIKMPANADIGCVFYNAEFRANEFKIGAFYNGVKKPVYVTSQNGEEGALLFNHTVTYVTGTNQTIPASVVHHGKKIGEINRNTTSGKTEEDYFNGVGDDKFYATPAPADPEREGYEFCGWFLEDTFVTPFNMGTDTVGENIVLYAKWEECAYVEVNFITNGGDHMNALMVAKHETMESVVPVRDGYGFLGWYYDIDLEQPFSYSDTLDKNTTLYAKWDGDHTVKFIVDGDTVRFISLNAGENYDNFPTLPDKEGFTSRWSIEKIENISQDIVVEGVYEIIKLTVTFNDDNGNFITSINVDYGDTLNGADLPVVPEKAGYDGRWSIDSIENLKENLTVTAIYEKKQITVTFRATGFDDIVRYVKYSEKLLQIPTCPYVEGKIGRWEVFNSENITENMTVNAVYETKKCEVTFYNANNEIIKTVEVDYGFGIDAAEIPPVEEKQGFTDSGWNIGDFNEIKSDLKVYPVYIIRSLEARYIVDGAFYESVDFVYGGEPILPENPYKTGYEFVAWTDAEGNEVDYRILTDDITLNAKFVKKQYTVKFIVDDSVVKVETVRYGESATEPVLSEEIMKNYSGWDSGFDYITRNTDVNLVKIDDDGGNLQIFAIIGGVLSCSVVTAAVIFIIKRKRKNVS